MYRNTDLLNMPFSPSSVRFNPLFPKMKARSSLSLALDANCFDFFLSPGANSFMLSVPRILFATGLDLFFFAVGVEVTVAVGVEVTVAAGFEVTVAAGVVTVALCFPESFGAGFYQSQYGQWWAGAG